MTQIDIPGATPRMRVQLLCRAERAHRRDGMDGDGAGSGGGSAGELAMGVTRSAARAGSAEQTEAGRCTGDAEQM